MTDIHKQQPKGLLRNRSGSLTLEAAVLLPLIASFMLGMSMFIQIAATQRLLDSTAREMTTQIAAHMYPAQLLYDAAAASKLGQSIQQALDTVKQIQSEQLDPQRIIDDDRLLWQAEVLQLMEQAEIARTETAISGSTEQLEQAAVRLIEPTIIRLAPKLYAGAEKLEPSRLHVKQVTMPKLWNRGNAYFGLVLQYEVKLNLPFFSRSITLEARSYEKAWVGQAQL